MALLLCANTLSGHTGLHKSVAMTANHMHRAGHPVTVINFLGSGDGATSCVSHWPLDMGLPTYALRSLPAQAGRLLHDDVLAATKERLPRLRYNFTNNGLAALRQLNEHLSADDTVIFTHPLQARIYDLALAGAVRRPRTILQIHGDYKVRHPELVPLLAEAAPAIDEFQIVATGMRDTYVDLVEPDRVTWIPNIHEPLEVRPVAHRGVRIALVGSFQESKNQLDAIRMLQRIDDPSVTLVLWGNARGEYADEVRALVDELSLGGRVSLPGVGNEREVYESTDIVVIPSLSEGFGYPLVEAASHGIPVVAYDYDYGPRDVISDGEIGFIVPVGDVEAMADRVRELAEDPDLRAGMGRAARKRYGERFAPDSVVAAYNKLIGEPGGERLDVPSVFAVEGPDPLSGATVRATVVRRTDDATWLRLSFRTRARLTKFEAATNAGARRLRAVRVGRTYHVLLKLHPRAKRKGGWRRAVVSYEVNGDRHYLGHTDVEGTFTVFSRLRREDNDTLEPDPAASPSLRDGRLVVPRHPRFAVVSGVDDFGTPLNADHGVTLRNEGPATKPGYSLSGEWERVEAYDGFRTRSVTPPMSYRELFERVCEAEARGGLFDISVDGIHPWELHRGAFIAKACEAFGLWAPHFSPATTKVLDEYDGPKRLADATGFRRVLFEFTRKPDGVDARTAAFHDDRTLIIESPQADGYSAGVTTTPNRYPIHEYNRWRASAEVATPEIDPRPFEEALSAFLGMPVELGARLEDRVRKFLLEREFWSPVFDAIGPDEVIIPSSHWQAGICEAGRRAGARVSDVQYALTSPLHPSFWFGATPRHGATHLYAWSPMWAERTNAYASHSFVPKVMPAPRDIAPELYDVLVISQPRVSRRMLRFVEDLTEARPDLRVAIAPHPDERSLVVNKLAAASLADRVEVVTKPTIEAIQEAAICVGGYSTSLYEAAWFGKPSYVIPVPGHELLTPDIEAGLFRLATSPEAIEPYAVPSWRTTLFGDPAH